MFADSACALVPHKNVTVGVSGFFKENIHPSTDVDDRTRLHVPKYVTVANLHPIEQALRRKHRQKAHERLLQVAKYIRQSDTSDIYDMKNTIHGNLFLLFLLTQTSNANGILCLGSVCLNGAMIL